jgi:hypothetical protein
LRFYKLNAEIESSIIVWKRLSDVEDIQLPNIPMTFNQISNIKVKTLEKDAQAVNYNKSTSNPPAPVASEADEAKCWADRNADVGRGDLPQGF